MCVFEEGGEGEGGIEICARSPAERKKVPLRKELQLKCNPMAARVVSEIVFGAFKNHKDNVPGRWREGLGASTSFTTNVGGFYQQLISKGFIKESYVTGFSEYTLRAPGSSGANVRCCPIDRCTGVTNYQVFRLAKAWATQAFGVISLVISV